MSFQQLSIGICVPLKSTGVKGVLAPLSGLLRKCFRDPWFIFDVCLVVVSYVGEIMAAVSFDAPAIIGQVLVLRALRLLRLIRALRMRLGREGRAPAVLGLRWAQDQADAHDLALGFGPAHFPCLER